MLYCSAEESRCEPFIVVIKKMRAREFLSDKVCKGTSRKFYLVDVSKISNSRITLKGVLPSIFVTIAIGSLLFKMV